jgi:hypothetical protein
VELVHLDVLLWSAVVGTGGGGSRGRLAFWARVTLAVTGRAHDFFCMVTKTASCERFTNEGLLMLAWLHACWARSHDCVMAVQLGVCDEPMPRDAECSEGYFINKIGGLCVSRAPMDMSPS